jgi:WD40 repeat protein
MTRRMLWATICLFVAISQPRSDDKVPQTKTVRLHADHLAASDAHLFLASAEGSLFVLDRKTLGDYWSITTDPVSSMNVSRKGDKLAVAHVDGTVETWTVEKKEKAWKVSVAKERELEALAFVDDDTVMVTQGIDQAKGKTGQVVLLEAKSGKVKKRLTFENAYLTSAAVVDSKRLVVAYAAAADEHRLALFDLATDKKLWDKPFQEGAMIAGVRPKGDKLLTWSTSADYEVAVVDVSKGETTATVKTDEQFISQALLVLDGQYAVVSGKSERLDVVDVTAGKLMGRYPISDVSKLGVARDGQHVYLALGGNGSRRESTEIRVVSVTELLERPKLGK